MRCIFCKQDSSTSRSVEHIIPESLGNSDHILPIGTVCDGCNNYMAREVEKPLLDSLYFRERRFYAGLTNKKGRIPLIEGIHLQSLARVELMKTPHEPQISIGVASDSDESRWVNSIANKEYGGLIIPTGTKPDDYVLSRFIAKIGLEALAHRAVNVPGALKEIVEKPELDELRRYVRRGSLGSSWPFSFRSLYLSGARFNNENDQYEVLHEFDILVTDQNEFYIVVAIFGDEYALNLGGPEIVGYHRWLAMNNYGSPLYSGKNA
jgi:hypothetical protein